MRENIQADATRRWKVAGFVGDTWRQFKGDLGAVPSAIWWRWVFGLVVGFLVCAGWVYLITVGAKGWEGLSKLDAKYLEVIVDALPMAFADAIMYESPGNLLYLGPLTIVVAFLATRRGKGLYAFSLVIGYLLQRPLVLFGWYLWDRSRPKLVHDGIAAPGFHSFPSGHTALSAFVYGFLVYLWFSATRSVTERIFAITVAATSVAVIAAGRLRLGAHWPSDIVAGALIALPWLAVMILLHRYLETSRRDP